MAWNTICWFPLNLFPQHKSMLRVLCLFILKCTQNICLNVSYAPKTQNYICPRSCHFSVNGITLYSVLMPETLESLWLCSFYKISPTHKSYQFLFNAVNIPTFYHFCYIITSCLNSCIYLTNAWTYSYSYQPILSIMVSSLFLKWQVKAPLLKCSHGLPLLLEWSPKYLIWPLRISFTWTLAPSLVSYAILLILFSSAYSQKKRTQGPFLWVRCYLRIRKLLPLLGWSSSAFNSL